MKQQKRRRQDRLQNFLIAALSISAVYLFFLTQSDPLDLQLPPLTLSSTVSEEQPRETSLLQEMDFPATLVVTDSTGARRCRFLSTAESEFTAVESLWESLFREGFSVVSVTEEEMLHALDLPGIFVSFPQPLPLCILCERLGLSSADESPMHRLLLVSRGTFVQLYYCADSQYFRAQTTLSPTELTATVESIGGDACRFAFERELPSALEPLTVLPETLPQLAQLAASTGEMESEQLLTFFGFNAHTTNRYVDAAGTEVIVESPRKLSISPTGRISYIGSVSYPPEGFALSDQPSASLSELVNGAYRLLRQLFSQEGDEASFYLSEVEQESSGVCRLRFTRMVNGLPLLNSDGSAAAEFVIEEGVVTGFTSLCRSYALSDTASLLLPLPQASALAAQYEGMELALSYVDSGGENAAVSWLMR